MEDDKERGYVKHFSGATVDHMKSYDTTSKSYENDLVILHVGTNDLREKKTAREIATNITELAIDLKTDKNESMISGIIPRNDKLDDNGEEGTDF